MEFALDSLGYPWSPQPETQPELKQLKFLIVEDDHSLHPLWSVIVEKIDPKAVLLWASTEEDAERAIKEFQKSNFNFDFVICDIFLAGKKSGVDLWRRFYNTKTQFLFTTGVTEEKFKELLGEDVKEQPLMLRKPLDPHLCIMSIRNLLDRRLVSKMF